MLKKIITILITIVLISSLTLPILADNTISGLQDKKDEAEEQQKEVEAEKSAIMKEVEELGVSIEENQEKLTDINSELIKLDKEIKELKKDLEETKEQYTKQEDALKQKIAIDYEKGKVSYLDVLLNSKGILDFISNYFLLSEIVEKDTELLTTIEEQKNKIESDTKQLEEKQKDVKTKKANQEKINVILTNQKSQKNNKISQLSSEEKELQKKIDEYDELIREAERQASRVASSGSTGAFVGGNKVWPCPASTRITSGYGGRNTGIPGATTNHKGIDIGCPIGSSVVSVLDGTVLFTGFNRARGYYIMVDHGGGVVTLYQHCSAGSFKASVGDKVKAGQTIVLSGNTGIGSGPHLHFEVLINGVNVNPQTWLQQG